MSSDNHTSPTTASIACTLCNAGTSFFASFRDRSYYRCTNCASVIMNPSDRIGREKERQRYQLHNNDVNDPGYQKFVKPIVDSIRDRFTRGHKGLDFGAGTGPVISKLLRDSGYIIEIYDPFFHNYEELLSQKYDYIVCCEVIEHFHCPVREFELLCSMLKKGGVLYCMTEPLQGGIDFINWYYKNDETHVIFYNEHTFRWIRDNIGFTDLDIHGRLVRFFK